MSSAQDRWYVSGPLGVGTDFSESVDAQSGGAGAWNALGSLLRHSGWDNLNLLDGRTGAPNQGPNLNWWGLNVAGKAVRLGAISARFSALADGGSAGYLSLHAKGPSGDVAEALRIDGNRNASLMAPGTLTVGAGGNGTIKVRHINGKEWQSDVDGGIYLNWNTGKEVVVGSPEVNSSLTVNGALTVARTLTVAGGNWDPTATEGDFKVGNATHRLKIGVATGGGGAGDTRIRAHGGTNRLMLGSGTVDTLFVVGDRIGIGTIGPQAKLHIGGGDLRLDGGHTISAGGRLHISGDEILYLLNRSGVIISKAWGGTGDLVVEGRIGVNGQSPTPRTRGWGGGIHTWDIEVEGTGWSRNGWQSGARDLAENFETLEPLEPGVVVSFHPDKNAVIQSTARNDILVCGVVSTRPGVLLNADADAPGDDGLAPVALCGRVPCQVVDENGPIRRGDLLTSSSVPGHAMRAESIAIDGERVYRSGTIVGKALESHGSGRGVIDIFVSPS